MKNHERMEGAPKSFRIRADNVPAGGLELSEVLKSQFVTKLIEEPNGQISWKSLADTELNFKIEHEADMLRLKGGGEFRVAHPCVRCMEDVEFEVTINFNTRLLPQEKDPDQGSELEAEAFDDMSSRSSEGADLESVASYYEHGIIDLTDLLREQLFLETPQYPNCSAAGAVAPKECDLSILESANLPSATVIEHPFARLKDWKSHSVN